MHLLAVFFFFFFPNFFSDFALQIGPAVSMNTFFNSYESLWHQNKSKFALNWPGIHHIKYSTLTIVVVNHIYKEGVTVINSNTDLSFSLIYFGITVVKPLLYLIKSYDIFSFFIFLNSNLDLFFFPHCLFELCTLCMEHEWVRWKRKDVKTC